MSRQLEWKQRMEALGRCNQCGGAVTHYKNKCDECAVKHRRLRRREVGSKPWKPGLPGRKPFIPDSG